MQSAPEVSLIEKIGKVAVGKAQIRQIGFRPSPDLGEHNARHARLDGVTNTCEDIVADVPDSPRVIIADKHHTWSPCRFAADPLQGPADEG